MRAQALSLLRQAGRDRAFFQEVDRSVRIGLAGMPVLLVFGERSPVMREGFPGQWRERIRDAGLHVVPKGHHFPMADDPDGVARAIREWRARIETETVSAEGG